MKKFDISTEEIELKIAYYFGVRQNLIVPNISWGLGIHECDLLCCTKAGYCTEVEIKRSVEDLKADRIKSHGHKSKKIKYLYFAVPSYLVQHIEHIPLRAGILVITSKRKVVCIAKPELNKDCRPLSEKEQYEMARLGALRIWDLKSRCIGYKNDRVFLLNQVKELKQLSNSDKKALQKDVKCIEENLENKLLGWD